MYSIIKYEDLDNQMIDKCKDMFESYLKNIESWITYDEYVFNAESYIYTVFKNKSNCFCLFKINFDPIYIKEVIVYPHDNFCEILDFILLNFLESSGYIVLNLDISKKILVNINKSLNFFSIMGERYIVTKKINEKELFDIKIYNSRNRSEHLTRAYYMKESYPIISRSFINVNTNKLILESPFVELKNFSLDRYYTISLSVGNKIDVLKTHIICDKVMINDRIYIIIYGWYDDFDNNKDGIKFFKSLDKIIVDKYSNKKLDGTFLMRILECGHKPVISRIFDYLDNSDILSFRAVNKKFKMIFENISRPLSKYLVYKKENYKLDLDISINKFIDFNTVKHLKITPDNFSKEIINLESAYIWIYEHDNLTISKISKLLMLKSLKILGIHINVSKINDHFKKTLFDVCDKINCLSLISDDYNDVLEFCIKYMNKFKNLNHLCLYLPRCDNLEFILSLNKLKTLYIYHKELSQVNKNVYSKLKSLMHMNISMMASNSFGLYVYKNVQNNFFKELFKWNLI